MVGEYFDPSFPARVEGLRLGHIEGFHAGQNAGYNEGFAAGRRGGWDEAVAACNAEMAKQLEFTRQHVEDKNRLQEQLAQQADLIRTLNERLAALGAENAQLRQGTANLQTVVQALKDANARLQSEVASLDEKYRKQTEEYREHMFKYNRNMVFLNAVRQVLEDLTTGPGEQPEKVRQMFAQRYTESVSKALSDGQITTPLDKDAAFARTLPKTQKFIVDMLSSVAKIKPAPALIFEHNVEGGPSM